MARRSKYREEYHLPWIRGLTRRGYTLDEIANDIGVAASTVKKWVHDFPELSDAVKKARALPDIEIEDALYNRAKGYKRTTTKTTIQACEDGSSKQTKVEVFEDVVPPDTTACIFWLKNRDRERWRDRQTTELTGKDGKDLLPEAASGEPLDILSLDIERFKQGMFGFICENGRHMHVKQREALLDLTDKDSREVFYGGAAGGAKSWTGAAWLTFCSLAYPGTRWFVGRSRLNDLREGTKITFAKVFNAYGIDSNQVAYNGQDNFYKFANGSTITFLEMRYLPSDPLYERYGSKEFTGGWIEEAGEVPSMAFEVVRSRVGRHMNDHYGLPPVLFITANPKRNWLYSRYYLGYVKGGLPDGVRVVLSGVDDNPFIESVYKENLEKLTDQVTKDRLLYGKWDYDTNPYALIDKLAYDDLFRAEVADDTGATYITADIARQGSDRAVILVWRGHTVIDMRVLPKSGIDELAGLIKSLMKRYQVPSYRVVADEDGVGGGVVDICKIRGFSNGGKVWNNENYANLKTQCAYKTASDINDGLYGFRCELDENTKEQVRQELEQLQNAAPDKDGKLTIKKKEDIKRDIGRSPDFSDAIIMRKYFDLFREQNDKAKAVINDYPV